MYIKLTRMNAQPIWLNAAFVVTVEPRNGGGSVVVPIGDGLDYDVREKPEEVLALLEGAPTPAVVPVPPPKGLAATPADVSPETDASAAGASVPEPSAGRKPAKGRARTRKAAAPKAEPAEPPAVTTKEFSAEQLQRLVRLAPRSKQRFANVLKSQLGVTGADPGVLLESLVAKGACEVDGEHIRWPKPAAAAKEEPKA